MLKQTHTNTHIHTNKRLCMGLKKEEVFSFYLRIIISIYVHYFSDGRSLTVKESVSYSVGQSVSEGKPNGILIEILRCMLQTIYS